MEKWLTTREAAGILGVSPGRVRQLALEGRLPFERFGQSLAFKRTDLKRFKPRSSGRPSKVGK
jgi:excisionase family DNA binding protein